jgi:hypothetical protein
VAMVPQGLVLLTSIAFAVSAMTLARRKVLTSELPAVEGLARVDVLCIDKTGTITSNRLRLREVIRLAEREPPAERLIGMFAASRPEPNATLQAIAFCLPAEPCPITTVVPFSSQRGWSLLAFAPSCPFGTFMLGAPEVLLKHSEDGIGVAETSRRLAKLSPEARAETLDRTTVFGRVSPQEKEEIIQALESRGHYVAMIGDGVNDVLALVGFQADIAQTRTATVTAAVISGLVVLIVFRHPLDATLPLLLSDRRILALVGALFAVHLPGPYWPAWQHYFELKKISPFDWVWIRPIVLGWFGLLHLVARIQVTWRPFS